MGHFSAPRLHIPRSRQGVSLVLTIDRLPGCTKRWEAIRRGCAVMAMIFLSSTEVAAQAITSEAAANQELLREQARAREFREKQELKVDVHLPSIATRESTVLKFDESPCL